MNIILSVGILIFTGYIFGELAEKIKLPKISGYILAGICHRCSDVQNGSQRGRGDKVTTS